MLPKKGQMKSKKSAAYWGCPACGHEVKPGATECWECERPRSFTWLNSAGSPANKKEISAAPKATRKQVKESYPDRD